jgi:hypothetical protein
MSELDRHELSELGPYPTDKWPQAQELRAAGFFGGRFPSRGAQLAGRNEKPPELVFYGKSPANS